MAEEVDIGYREMVDLLKERSEERFDDEAWSIVTRLFADGTYVAVSFHKEMTAHKNDMFYSERYVLSYKGGQIREEHVWSDSDWDATFQGVVLDPTG